MDAETLADVEGDAAFLLKKAGYEATDTPSVRALCERLLGTAPRVARLRNEATCSRVGDEWRIYVRRGTPPARARWLVGHELAEWWYSQLDYRDSDREDRCDALGAALVAPRRAVIKVAQALGHDVPAIAAELQTTQSLVLLRLGEVLRLPVVLAQRHRLVQRGEEWEWGRLSYAEAVRAQRFAPYRVTITDEASRVGLLAAA